MDYKLLKMSVNTSASWSAHTFITLQGIMSRQGGIFLLFAVFEGDIFRKHFSWNLGCCFESLVLPHAYKLWKKSVHDTLSEICISESTPPTVTKRASQFRRPLLRRKEWAPLRRQSGGIALR